MSKPSTRSIQLHVMGLESRLVPAGFVLSESQPGQAAIVRVFDGTTGAVKTQFVAFAGYTGGLFAAAGADRNRDGLPDRIAVGTRGGTTPHVKVFDGSGNLLQSFFAYDAGFLGGVNVALGDVTGDGRDDVVTGAAAGTSPHVKVFDGATSATLQSFMAFDDGFKGGVNVGAGDTNRDGRDDVIVGAAAGTSPHVKVFDGRNPGLLKSFFAFDGAFVGGVRVAGGDLNHDGLDDIIVGAGPGAGSHVKVFKGDDLSLLSSKIVFESTYAGGVYVEVNDVSGNGLDDLVVERASGGARFRAFDDNGVDGPTHDLNDVNGASHDINDDRGGR
ncbi:VCBS repeat-containing protein [Gemmata sp. JC717]|uniref:FG-GAP repeat domain-containing protein n=1 Tax=Gemmata algarum TaxID=2975278 RepID=UPI0021BA7BC4|nr:VCBS repeat-containing protein [Gemmata algarum]MDY3555762.1 VCBS repeat-containing protein [Gemmata algarum]